MKRTTFRSWASRVAGWAMIFGGADLLLGAEPKASEPKGARLVQLYYDVAPGTDYYLELIPRETASGTYFCAVGFDQGYLGLQELGAATNRIIQFTLWDAGAEKNAKTNRIQVASQHPDLKVDVLDGEPVGLQCTLPLAWKINETYRLFVKTRSETNVTAYSAYLQDPVKTNQWLHVVTLNAPANPTPITGCYSFIEDFQRTTLSAGQRRWSSYGNGWLNTKDDVWLPLTHALFEGEASTQENIDAGPMGEPGWYFLGTGGSVTNVTTKLKGRIDIPAASRSAPVWIRKFEPTASNAFAALALPRPVPAPLIAPGQMTTDEVKPDPNPPAEPAQPVENEAKPKATTGGGGAGKASGNKQP